ncbi:MAG: XRE family transcriptional regulator [Rhizobium sp.]|nr:MAG: XRE family transcriptional regulator [Rhizobium sp.]
MANFQQELKKEISRLSRKAARAELAVMDATVKRLRAQTTALRVRLDKAEREVALLKRGRQHPQHKSPSKLEPATDGLRFSAKGLTTLRNRLGLSAAQMGELVGVSRNTIYNWESKTTEPTRAQLRVIADLRTAPKRETRERLGL